MKASVLDLDCSREATRICDWMRRVVGQDMRRRGVVIGISGGVDSAVCAALAVQAFGRDKVFGLLMPEPESSETGTTLGKAVVSQLDIRAEVVDIGPTLDVIGCYRHRDEAIRRIFPEYAAGWKSKIAIAGGMSGGFNYFNVIVQSPDGGVLQKKLPYKEYLQIVAATNFKQRIRKTLEYFHADRLNYAVIGTPNRLEYDQGFFVKNGDGAADIKPIAHLYKRQVYDMARHLRIPEAIRAAKPTTDTYSLQQGQDEFYFALPHEKMDYALWAYNNEQTAGTLAEFLGLTVEQAENIYLDIAAKRRATRHLHTTPAVLEHILRVEPC